MNIIYTNEDGSVAVFTPTQEALGLLTLDKIAERVVPNGVNYSIVSPDTLPTDRAFRGAWQYDQDIVSVDLNKAKEISHSKRREARTAEFAPLDIQSTIPVLAEQAEAERQLVRDKYAAIQTQIDGATTVEDLKAIITQF